MAELILTEEEKAAALWSDLSDDAVGKLVKQRMAMITTLAQQNNQVIGMAAALLLICELVEVGADGMVMDIDGVTHQGREVGDWVLRIEPKTAAVAPKALPV